MCHEYVDETEGGRQSRRCFDRYRLIVCMKAVERFKIPTPFDMGQMNAYCFSEDDITLMAGPATDEAYEELVTHLNDLGSAVADVERILITHPHMDHFGIASRIKENSGAEVLAHEDTKDPLAHPKGFFDRRQAFFRPYFMSMGVPRQIVDTVIELPGPYAEFREPVTVDRELADGDIVDVGDQVEAVHTPGHASVLVCFITQFDGVAFTGDHVLRDVSPNPLLTLDPDMPTERTRSLPTYLDSLRKL